MIGPGGGCLLSGRQCGMVMFAGSGNGRFPKHLLVVGGDIISSYWWWGAMVANSTSCGLVYSRSSCFKVLA